MTKIIQYFDLNHRLVTFGNIGLQPLKLIPYFMKALVVYSSNFGNTKVIADSIAGQLGNEALSVSVNDIKEPDLEGINLLVLGSPIDAWKPDKKIGVFMDNLNKDKIRNIPVAAFDTRVKLFIKGNVSKNIEKALKTSVANLIVPPIGFYVNSKQGPLLGGEKEKAKAWAKLLESKLKNCS